MSGNKPEYFSEQTYDPNCVDLNFRFKETNFDFINLNARDWSLIEVAGIPLGFSYKDSSLEKQMYEMDKIIEYLATQNKGLSQPYGKTPWSGDRG